MGGAGLEALDELDLLGEHRLLALVLGLLLGLASALPAVLFGEPLLTAQWWTLNLGQSTELKLSTVLLFDIGVYFAVLGTILTIVVSLTEAGE